ncbi:MAG: hypothetical protein QOI51_183 [Nocardioidaceae bacterium]|jgi:hypothetical protein|nr:hypothetical protein [Nocardioidaceae bacterium]MDX6308866.1 hypothetical protein [Nocardioidaceae bacterium]
MKRVIFALAAVACAGIFASPATAATTTQCTSTLTGGTYDKIVVPAGATCTLDGATVNSNVTVGAGSSLHTRFTTIGGNVMSRDAASVRLIDTNISHNVMITGTTGSTKIGSKGCKVDPIAAGNLMFKFNSGTIAICDVSVGHNLALMANSGRIGAFRNVVGNNGLLFRNTGPANRLRDNTVTVNINCSGNTGRVITSGNTAAQLMGQCHS